MFYISSRGGPVDVEIFEMERMQSAYEHQVELNLSESGVRPLTAEELLDGDDPGVLLRLELGYPEPPGSDRLRGNIADWYPGATTENVVVTNGGAEANFLTLWTLLGAGDRLAFMLPDYMQGWGLGRAFGRASDAYHLRLEAGGGQARWGLDVGSLENAVRPDTKVIWVCNPNNPTAAVLREEEMDAIVSAADQVGATIVADEIYRGAELEGDTTPTFWGRYDKVVITSGLSKAFGLPGLRLGWVVADPDVIRRVLEHRDYTSLMVGALSDELASRALEPQKREWIFRRTREILRTNVAVVDEFATANQDLVSYARPRAGAIAFFDTDLAFDSNELADRLRRDMSVLVVPGQQLGLERGFRIGFGYDREKTRDGIQRVERLLRESSRAAVG
jgi:aspartate/methionine/tyrosine aminotransferase